MAKTGRFRLIATLECFITAAFGATGKKRNEMAAMGLIPTLFAVGILVGGCMQSTLEPASEANFTPRDKKLLAAAPYAKAMIPEPYRRHVVEYHRKEAPPWSGVDRIGRMTEWPTWTPPAEIKKRLDVPDFVESGPQNPMGARAMYLFEGNKDTLYRIHGTNQPEYIGQAISSGCIRMTNEDVIDLYKRVKLGTVVVVLAPQQGDSPFNPRVASTGGLSN